MSLSAEILARSPLAYWKLNESSGTTAADSSGNGRDATYGADATLGATALIPGDTSMSVAATTNGNATIADAAWMDVNTGAIVGHFATTSSSAQMIGGRNQSGNQWMFLDLTSANLIRFYITTSGQTVISASSTGYRDGNMHQVVGTYDGTNMKLYVDGVEVATSAKTGNLNNATQRFGIGARGDNTTPFNGRLGHFAVFGAGLSPSDVTALWNAATGAVTVSGGQVTVTSTAQAGTVNQTIAGGVATVTATALAGAIIAGSVISGGIASETDTAQAGTVTTGEIVSGGTAAETDTVQAGAVTGSALIAGGQAGETDTALAGTVAQVIGGGQATETSTALGGNVVTVIFGGQAGETITVFTGSTGGVVIPGGTAEETAYVLAGTVYLDYSETDTSNADDGIFLGDGLAEIVWEPDVVPPPVVIGPPVERDARTAAVVINTAPTGWATPAFTKGLHQYAYKMPAMRPRILIGDVDWTYPNDVPTVLDDVKFIDPLKYGTAQLTIKAINPWHPPAFLGNVVDYFRGKRVTVQLVIDHDDAPAEIVVPDYHKSWVTRVDTDGPSLVLMLGGEAAGRLSALVVPPMVYTRRQTVEHIIVATLHDARVKAVKGDADDTAVVIRRGGTDGLTLVNEHVAIDAATSGDPITYWPDSNGVYRRTVKDTETIHGTVYLDGGLVNQSLSQDFMEQPNYAYVRGETRTGELIANFKTPGQTQGPAPDFPLSSGVLENGMTNADTDSGAGITALQQQLAIHDFYDYDEGVQGTFEDVLEDGVRNFQRFARLTVTGTVNETTWNRLYNLQKIGYSLDGAQEFPTAADPRLDRFLRTANGSKYAANPEFDPHIQPVGLWIDGGRMTKRASAQLAESKLAPEGGIWTGTLTFKSGFIWGDHTPGDPVTEEMVADRRELLPNMNLKVVWFAGSGAEGIVFHVSGKDDGPEESQALVSTHPAPTMETFAANERLREARSNLGRAWSGHVRASQVRQDNAGSWDTSSGWLGVDVALSAGWNEVVIPAGQSGIVQRIDMELADDLEFAVILSQGRLGMGRLDTIDPLANTGDNIWTEVEATADWFERRGVLKAWGWHKQPCGYDPGKKSSGGAVTGKFREKAGLNYTTNSGHGLYAYTFVYSPTTLLSGRILRNQRTTDY